MIHNGVTATGGVDRPLHSHTVRLTYADTDPAGILYYAAWFPMMERLQSEWFYLQGLRQDTLEEQFGFRTITRAVNAEYLLPVGLFDEIRIEFRIGELGGASFAGNFRMLRCSDNALVGRATLSVVTVSAEGSAIRVPDTLRERLAAWSAYQRGAPDEIRGAEVSTESP